ncbi:MAG TPA: hypothetical protein VNA20_03185, partial [Frankiaceae bacterium]|nr:hypothetical protein [Frankiaceae bacterium]
AWAQARLRAECRKLGHAIADNSHTGDLWIAATAVRYNIPLVAHDGIFNDVPKLQLITEL